ncbi:MAG: hypothetical protein H6579_09590 [Chitinophagales bacterium]|nr:hypothetical protein [Chitinophagales bacterium]
MKKCKLIVVVCLFFGLAYSQEKDDPIAFDKALLISPIISVQIPGADFAKRFGLAYQFGLGLDYKFGRNWLIGAEGGFLFSTNVKEKEQIANTLTGTGLVITTDGFLDNVNLNLRGAVVKLNAGKSFFFKAAHPSNGVLLKFGLGYLSHKILIDVNKKNTPQLTGNYAKGYDRFSQGLVLSQYLGLIRVQKGKFVNLSLGFEISEAITKNSRPYDFYLGRKLNETRLDLMYGIKFCWHIPVFLGESTKNQYYYY